MVHGGTKDGRERARVSRGPLVTSEISTKACVKGPTEIGDRTNDALLAPGRRAQRADRGIVPDRRAE